MQTDLSNVLNKLKPLSDNNDIIIYEHNSENIHVNNWIESIKRIADAIIGGSSLSKSSLNISSVIEDTLPNLVGVIKGKQNECKHRISTLLAEVQKKDHVQHNKGKPRNSLRKIVLSKKSGNRWVTSNSKKSNGRNSSKRSVSRGGRSNSGRIPSNSPSPSRVRDTKSIPAENEREADTYSTPIQDKEILVPNTEEVIKESSLESRKGKPRPRSSSPQKKHTLDSANKETSTIGNTETFTPSDKVETLVLNTTYVNPDSDYTPLNQTRVIDCKKTNETPSGLKRKSTIQLTNENVKKSKTATTEEKRKGRSAKRVKQTRDNVSESKQSLNKMKSAKNTLTAVIQPNTSLILQQQAGTPNEKRILREIQKKEEIVSQNTKKLRSIRQMKIEENKKTREIKMEKAMQQRLKMEKEKEERMRSRTVSRQENNQQKESAKKKTQKKIIQQEAQVTNAKATPVSSKKKLTTSPTSTTNEDTLSKKAPPKPVRSAKKTKPPPVEKNPAKDAATPRNLNETFCTNTTVPASSKDNFVKPLNTTYVGTPTAPARKVESSMNTTKTPLPNAVKKLTSYAMTPTESSFVSYDISEIKSDDDDDEEEESNRKPIPNWASGIRLRNALLNQHYDANLINLDELFGNYYEEIDLEAMMGVQKKRYFKRTSSAVWANSPNRSIIN